MRRGGGAVYAGVGVRIDTGILVVTLCINPRTHKLRKGKRVEVRNRVDFIRLQGVFAIAISVLRGATDS
jgi:hypothetical protein